MTGTVAIVAHFDPDNRLDPTFVIVLETLIDLCEKVILVTASELSPLEAPTGDNITIVQRPNIGYDFYSYRVGLDLIRSLGGCDRFFLVNSSFLVLERKVFRSTLNAMIDKLGDASVVAITESYQLEWHLQSYLLLFRGDILTDTWFIKWRQRIEPQNTKLETIIQGEFGLSRAIAANGISFSTVFKAMPTEAVRAQIQWARRAIIQARIWQVFKSSFIRQLTKYNPSHFLAREVAERCGIAKTELLRDNPYELDIRWTQAAGAADERGAIQDFVVRSRSRYRSSSDGLTTLDVAGTNLPNCRLVYSAPPARPGVRVAVVVHMFYPQMMGEIADLLENFTEPFDLYVTTPNEGAIPDIFNRLGRRPQCVAVALCENRGRDIGPFLSLHRRGLLDPYEAILKLHTKRSAYSENGERWRRALYESLCSDSGVVHRALALLRTDGVGIIGPHEFYLSHASYWGGNQNRMVHLMEMAGINVSPQGPRLGFFAGSMFWFKPAAFRSLHLIPQEQLTFEPEAGQQDATLAHAFERIFCDVARSAGFRAISLVRPDEDIANSDADRNSVPVLPIPA